MDDRLRRALRQLWFSAVVLLLAGLIAPLRADELPIRREIARDLALSLEASGQAERAYQAFRQLDLTGDSDSVILAGRVRLALATGRPDEARSLADRLEAATGLDELDRLLLLAEVRLLERDAAKLRPLVRDLMAYRDDPATLAVMVRLLLASGQAGEAAKLLETALRGRPAQLDLALLASEAYVALKQPARVAALLTPWLTKAKGPERRTLLELLARSEFEAGRPASARPFAAELLASAPADTALLRLALEIEEAAGDPRAAMAFLERLMALAPDDRGLHLLRLEMLRRRGDKGGMVEEARALLRLDPGLRDVRRTLIWTLVDLKYFGEALDAVGPLASGPDAPLEDLKLLADCAIAAGQKERAAQALTWLAARKPDATTLRLLAENYFERQLHADALETALRWRQLAPTDARAAVFRYQCLVALDCSAEALVALREALAMEVATQDRGQLELDLFYLLAKSGDRQGALEQARKLLAQRPGADDIRQSAAYLLADLGDRTGAVAMFRPLVDRPLAQSERELEFVELLLAANQRAEGVLRLEKLTGEERAVAGTRHRRLLEVWSGEKRDWPRAMELGRSMARAAADEPEALAAIVRAWIAIGRPAEVRELLETPWETIRRPGRWLEQLTAEYQLLASRWKEALATLGRAPAQTAWQQRSMEAQAWSAAPPELAGRTLTRIASARAAGVATVPETAREFDRLERSLTEVRVEGILIDRHASDGLRETGFDMRGTGRIDSRDRMAAGLRRVDISRGGLARAGEVASVSMSRQITTGEAITADADMPVGIEGAGAIAPRIGYLATPGTHGDPVRVELGREFISESPGAWARGLGADTARVTHERPRDGKGVSLSAQAVGQRLDDGIARGSVTLTGRLRPHPRVESTVTLDARHSSGTPDPANLYFAPRDYQALDADATWHAAKLGRFGDWYLRAGRHFDRVRGSPAKGGVLDVRAELPLGPADNVSFEWTRFTNSANRIGGLSDGYSERTSRVSYNTRF